MTQLDIPTAAARLAELVAAAAAGEEVVIADGAGRPVARLVSAAGPVVVPDAVDQGDNTRDRVLGMFVGQVQMSDDFQAPLTDLELRSLGL